jgi:chromosome segregation ATPase
MKKGVFILVTVLAVLSCNNEKTNKQSVSIKDSADVIINQSDSIFNNYLSSFDEIEHSLNSISERQKTIYTKTEKPAEPKMVVVNEINAEITAINSLMQKNQKIIAQLNNKLKSSNTKNEKLERIIAELNEKLSQKQKDLSALNTKLNQFSAQIVVLYTDIYILNAENANQADIINEQYRYGTGTCRRENKFAYHAQKFSGKVRYT